MPLAVAITALFAGTALGQGMPSGGHVWAQGVSGSLSAFNPLTFKSVAQAPASGAIALSGNRQRLFGMEAAVGRVFEINVRTLLPTPIVDLKQPLSGLCASPDGSRLMLISSAKKTLHLVDTGAKNAALLPLDGKGVKACQFSPDGSFGYAAVAGADDVLVIDLKGSKVAGKVTAEGAAPTQVTEIFIHPNPGKKLALVAGGSQIWYLDTVTHKVSGAVTALGAPIQSLAFHPDGTRFFALAHDKVFVVDLASRKLQKTMELPAGAFFRGVAIDAQGKRLFLSGNHETDGGVGAFINKEGKEFVAIDLETGKKSYQAFPPVQSLLFIVTP